MGKIKTTIEINGKKYDALTGALVSHVAAPRHNTTKKPRSVDGVISPHKNIKVTPSTVHAVTRPKAKKVVIHDAVRAPKHPAKHSPQASQTLMRNAVKKPDHAHKLKVQGPANSLARKKAAVLTKSSAHRLDERRLQHAKHVPKSGRVKRFAPISPTIPAPVAAPKTVKHAAPRHHAPHKPQPIIKHPKTTADVLEQALHHATAHAEPLPKKSLSRKQRITSLSALAVALFVVVGVVAVQSLPGAKVKFASSKAGFEASMPSYKPSGYHLGALDYSAGVVAMRFNSNSDQNRTFAITQKSSAWDSSTLRDNFVMSADKNFEIVQTGGRTLYLYGQNNATWVDRGVWYQVQGSGALSTRQLVDIAKSM